MERRTEIVSDDINKKTQETAAKLFGWGIKMDPPYLMWKQFDKDLANDLSRHIVGNVYSRTVLSNIVESPSGVNSPKHSFKW